MEIKYEIQNDNGAKKSICREVLEDLPLWFGIPESTNEYCEGVQDTYFICASNMEGIIGFISLKRNSPFCLEIYVMGIKEKYHRFGIGKSLINLAIEYGRKSEYKYLEVKTLDESRESKEYKQTREFYYKNGFIPIDVLLNEWGNDNPCLIMILNIN